MLVNNSKSALAIFSITDDPNDWTDLYNEGIDVSAQYTNRHRTPEKLYYIDKFFRIRSTGLIDIQTFLCVYTLLGPV